MDVTADQVSDVEVHLPTSRRLTSMCPESSPSKVLLRGKLGTGIPDVGVFQLSHYVLRGYEGRGPRRIVTHTSLSPSCNKRERECVCTCPVSTCVCTRSLCLRVCARALCLRVCVYTCPVSPCTRVCARALCLRVCVCTRTPCLRVCVYVPCVYVYACVCLDKKTIRSFVTS